MKLVLSLLVLISGSIAFATPAVGDYANYNLTVIQGGQTLTGSYELAIVGKTATGFKVTTTITVPDQPAQYEEQDVAANQMLGDAQIGSILGQCSMYGGTLESVTVPAGTFETCNLPTDTGRASVASVPFGIVKQSQKSESGEMTIELKSFVVGQ